MISCFEIHFDVWKGKTAFFFTEKQFHRRPLMSCFQNSENVKEKLCLQLSTLTFTKVKWCSPPCLAFAPRIQTSSLVFQMAPDYDHLTLMEKVEVFEHAVNNTAGDDLAKLLWLKSPSSEVRRRFPRRHLGGWFSVSCPRGWHDFLILL